VKIGSLNLGTTAGLSVQEFARKIKKSVGWVSQVENGVGDCRISEAELDRIVELLGAKKHREMFRTWVANHRNAERINQTFDGAVLKFIRIKKQIRLVDAAKKIGVSTPHLSKIERGLRPITIDQRKKIMSAYGYSPSSFKNLSTDPVRSKAVPASLKLEIIMARLSAGQIEAVYNYARELFLKDAQVASPFGQATKQSHNQQHVKTA